MSAHYDIQSRTTRSNYVPPRGTVLLLSCMDPRLLDDVVAFMNRDNLTNRYDHVILAGAALGTLQDEFPHWRDTFFEHLKLAVALHNITDIYIVEHRNCGAYNYFRQLDYGNSPAEQDREQHDHTRHAFELADRIADWSKGEQRAGGVPLQLNVHCFLMDLRGDVIRLEPEVPPESVAAG